MNSVAKQGIKYSIVGYLGLLLGTFSVVFIFPYDMAFYGELRYLLSSAQLFLPVVVFGISLANVKFFYSAQKQQKHQNLLSLSAIFIFVNFWLIFGLYYLANTVFPSLKNTELWQMKGAVFALVIFLSLSNLLSKYISNYAKIALPNVFENLFPKLANLLAFSAFVFWGMSLEASQMVFVFVFFLALAGYFLYANYLEKFSWDISTQYVRNQGIWKEILEYGFYVFLGNMGYYIALRIDNFMIGEFLGFEQNGIYNILLSILSLIMIPQVGMQNLAAPVVNQYITEKKIPQLNRFYQATALSLLLQGCVFFLCLTQGFPFLCTLLKNGEKLLQAQPILWILGLSMLFDLATSFNGQIISLSKYYKYNILIMMFLSAVTIGLNWFFIQFTSLGILGIAIASGISLFLFNLIKISFIYSKLQLCPFSRKMLWVCGLFLFYLGLISFFPAGKATFWGAVWRCSGVIFIFGIGNYFLQIVPLGSLLPKKKNLKIR